MDFYCPYLHRCSGEAQTQYPHSSLIGFSRQTRYPLEVCLCKFPKTLKLFGSDINKFTADPLFKEQPTRHN